MVHLGAGGGAHRVRARVEVHGDERNRVECLRNFGAGHDRHPHVGLAGHHHRVTGIDKRIPQLQCHVEIQIGLAEASPTDRSGLRASVARVEHEIDRINKATTGDILGPTARCPDPMTSAGETTQDRGDPARFGNQDTVGLAVHRHPLVVEHQLRRDVGNRGGARCRR